MMLAMLTALESLVVWTSSIKEFLIRKSCLGAYVFELYLNVKIVIESEK